MERGWANECKLQDSIDLEDALIKIRTVVSVQQIGLLDDWRDFGFPDWRYPKGVN